ncbi:MAG: restriction endonuclease subunit S, partial [Candidatus Saccharibacteria bacterium]|nr:restriction endonuclease subunit S [Candidatus Saccharibacteria bacterium]
MKVKLGDLIEEYSERNVDNKYKPVAVGKYGIRTRESIYSKELAKDYSKNKLIYKGTLTVGMGSNQIDIGILRDDETYSVSPAYHTYKIKISNYDYLDYLLAANNNRMFSIYANRGSRQGKTLDLKRWLTDELYLHDEKDQKIIVQTLNTIKLLISKKEAELVKLDNLIKARFVEMFGNVSEHAK